MYTLTQKEVKDLQFIEISNPDNSSKATLCLNQGGRLSDLMFKKTRVLADFDPSTYKDNYASSILFPFANRVRDGKYTFDGHSYVLNCNEVDKNNALHGLVYDKPFDCVDSSLSVSSGSVTLQYKHEGCKGFPFQFHILLIYTLTDETLSLAVEIINKGHKTFPFTLGWHPYFASKNLDESALSFESATKYLCDAQHIVSGTAPFDVKMPFQLKNVTLDDGYQLQNNTFQFYTPGYHLTMTSSSNDNYLQLYTPKASNVIAIEPMTGATDSFNNKIGLQILQPNSSYSVLWNITFEKLTDKIQMNQLIN